jgi:IS30 family transposase
MKYYQLNLKSRQLIQYLYNEERLSITKISDRLKINKSTISQEIKMNSNFGIYDAEIANKKALNRHSHKYFFNNMKYAEFTNLFLEFFEKNFFGINATYHCIDVKFPKVKKPCLRQIFNLINSCN